MGGYIAPGKIWRMMYGGMPASIFLVPDTTLVPVGGDLCNHVNAKPSAVPTTPGSPTTEDRTIRYICVEGRNDGNDLMNRPGIVQAPTSSRFGRYSIGANRAHVPNATSKLKAFVPVTDGLIWVMQLKPSADAPTLHAGYGIDRDATTNNQTIDTADTADVVMVLSIYEPDYLANGANANWYWVKAALPGGYV